MRHADRQRKIETLVIQSLPLGVAVYYFDFISAALKDYNPNVGEQQTRTFMFTDIERSTELWETAPNSMRLSLETHNQIIDHALQAHGGKLFKRIGDATCSAFQSPAHAAAAARTGQLAIKAHNWPSDSMIRVRWAIHKGTSVEEPDGDHLGPGVNYVARILNLAFPGQILLSEEAAQSLPEHSTTFLGLRLLISMACNRWASGAHEPSRNAEFIFSFKVKRKE